MVPKVFEPLQFDCTDKKKLNWLRFSQQACIIHRNTNKKLKLTQIRSTVLHNSLIPHQATKLVLIQSRTMPDTWNYQQETKLAQIPSIAMYSVLQIRRGNRDNLVIISLISPQERILVPSLKQCILLKSSTVICWKSLFVI